MIEKLTSEQEALIPVYCDKWRKIALSSKRIDRHKAAEALNDAYTYIGLDEPKIICCDSPYAALNHPYHQIREQLCTELWVDIHTQINNQVDAKLLTKLLNQTSSQLETQLNFIASQLDRQLDKEFDTELVLNCLKPELLACYGSTFDFCISVLHCNHNQREWLIYQSLAKFCGWILFYKKTCIVCDRPLHLLFDNQNRLHALM
jgi:hypothetical protein